MNIYVISHSLVEIIFKENNIKRARGQHHKIEIKLRTFFNAYIIYNSKIYFLILSIHYFLGIYVVYLHDNNILLFIVEKSIVTQLIFEWQVFKRAAFIL